MRKYKSHIHKKKFEHTSSGVGCGFSLNLMGLPTTTYIGLRKGRGDLQKTNVTQRYKQIITNACP